MLRLRNGFWLQTYIYTVLTMITRFAILMIIFLCACTQKDPQVLLEKKQYPKEIQALKSEVLPIEEEILDGRIGIFGCNASVFMIEDLGDEEGFLHFYDWDTGKLIRKYGTIGRGPEEYLLPIALPYRDSIIINSVTRRGIFGTKGIDSLSPLSVKDMPIPKESLGAKFFYPLNDSMAIFSAVKMEQQFSLLNLKTGRIRSESHFPDLAATRHLPLLVQQGQVFIATYGLSPDRENLVGVYLNYPIVDVLNLKNFQIKRSVFDVKHRNDFSYDKARQKITYSDPYGMYSRVVMKDSCFYALFFNSRREDRVQHKAGAEIQQFDYSGNVLHRYQLDLPIYSFCVNEEKRCFLAMVYTKDRIPMVVKYAY